MRRPLIVGLLIVTPILAIGATPASACGTYGYRGCGYCAPSAYRAAYYRPGYSYRAYYRPRFAYGSFYRPRVWGWRGGVGRSWGWREGRRW